MPHSTGCGYTISIHALREEGDPDRHPGCHDHCISIHALREEGDVAQLAHHVQRAEISIHALREEGDYCAEWYGWRRVNFYPRPPRGGRHVRRGDCGRIDLFLSTPSARRATVLHGIFCGICKISIHALREEGDYCPIKLICCSCDFYPRPPRGGRRCGFDSVDVQDGFLSTPSARRATSGPSTTVSAAYNFYPRPPRGGRL